MKHSRYTCLINYFSTRPHVINVIRSILKSDIQTSLI